MQYKDSGESCAGVGRRAVKNTVLILMGGLTLLLTILIMSAVYEKMNFDMEVESNLSSVMEKQLYEVISEESEGIENTQIFLAGFIQQLIVALDGKYDLTVEVLQLDLEKGIMSVRVQADFLYLNGKPGVVTCEKTVIFNQLQ